MDDVNTGVILHHHDHDEEERLANVKAIATVERQLNGTGHLIQGNSFEALRGKDGEWEKSKEDREKMQYKEELEYEIDLKKRTADFDGEHSKKLWVSQQDSSYQY